MTPTRTWLLAAFLFVSLLAAHARAAEPPGLNDAAARDRLEEMERAGVLADPWWARAYWLRAETAPTEQARTADLRWALRFDPDFTRARRDLAFSLLRQRDGEFAEQLRLAVTRSLSSFPGQIRALLAVFAIVFGATLLAAVALATLAVAKILPRVHHGLRERLLFLPAELRSGVALLTIALPLLVALTLPPTAAVFWALLFGLVGTWTRLDRGERRVGVVALVTLLATPIALSAWTRLGDPLLPGSYLYSLWDLQVGIDATATSNVDTNAPKSAEPDAHRLAALALAERRAGDYHAAESHLREALELAPDDWSLHNNFGNVQLLLGDADAALASYAEALSLAPDQALPHVNRAQAYVRNLDFRKADDALETATRLGYRLPPRLTTEALDIVVRDEVLDASALWARAARGEGRVSTFDRSRAYGAVADVLLPIRPLFLSAPLLLILWWVAKARDLPRAARCAGCSRWTCRKCHYRVQRRSYCAECHAVLRDVQAPLKRAELLEGRRRHATSLTAPALLALSFLAPGSGLVILGARRRAVWYVRGALVILTLALLAPIWPDPVLRVVRVGSSLPLILGVAWALLGGLSLRETVQVRRHSPDKETTEPGTA